MPEGRKGIWVDMSEGLNNLIDDLARFMQITRKQFITDVVEREVYLRLSALPFDVEEMLAGLDEEFPGGERLATFAAIADKVNAKEVTPYEEVEVMSEDIPGGE